MKNITLTTALLCVMLCAPVLFSSCEDKMDEHYDTPKWLKGSAWKVLEDRGNYSIFLKGVEMAGYKPLLEGKSILTMMAPDDLAFKAYLQAHDYAEISEMPTDERNKLIGFHLLYYSYNTEKLINFRPKGDSDEEPNKDAGLYYKFRTRSSNVATEEIDRSNGKLRMVYHLDRFIPVFSYRFFETKKLNAETNYNYFYPNSTWKGSNGFNVSNAAVNEYAIIADNGYIYTIDQVLEPLETLYTELEKNEDYSVFYNLYNKYSSYDYDAALSQDFAKALGTDSLFIHRHGLELPGIAVEWYSSDYTQIADNASKAYSIFAPTDVALNKFFNDFWAKGDYESLDDVDEKVIKYMMNQYIYKESAVFPEEILNGTVKNAYGMTFNFDPATVKDKAMCVNGTFYGLGQIQTPTLFASVVGPAFRNKNCNYYLYMLDGSSLITSYASQDAKYTLLLPNNEQIEQSNIYLNSYTTGSVLQEETSDGWTDLPSSRMSSIVNMHTTMGDVTLKTSGTQVLPTQTGYNYWYVKDGRITSSAKFNQLLEPTNSVDPFVALAEVKNGNENWNNGKTYFYESEEIFKAEDSDGLAHQLAVCNDQRFAYYAFVQLMKKAELVNTTTSTIPFLVGSRFITFIPTNDAIQAALAGNQIPGITNGSFDSNGTLNVTTNNLNVASLRTYLLSYFLLNFDNVMTTYPYPGSAMKSNAYTAANKKALKYTDMGNSLSVQLENGDVAQVIPDYNCFPFAFRDGCFQLIHTVL